MGIFEKKRLKQKEEVMEQYVVRLYRGFGTSLARRLINTAITPNQITMAGLGFVIIASLFFAAGNYAGLIAGSLILFFSIVLDFTDGTLARMRNASSMFGDWLDAMSDELREVIVHVSICLGIYKSDPAISIWILCLIILASDRVIFRTTNKLYKILPYTENEISAEVKDTFKVNKLLRISKEFLSVRLLKYTLIPVFFVFNKPKFYLIFAAFYGVILALAFLWYSISRIKKEEKKIKK